MKISADTPPSVTASAPPARGERPVHAWGPEPPPGEASGAATQTSQGYEPQGKPLPLLGAAASGGESAPQALKTYDRRGRIEEQAPPTEDAPEKAPPDEELEPDEERRVQRLERTDRRVRRHEAAHLAAGGGVVKGGARYEMTKGPDGELYATGGEVAIDTAAEDTPEKTIVKMQRVIQAALAPADPSPQDRKVAAQANSRIASARMEMLFSERDAAPPPEGERTDSAAAAHGLPGAVRLEAYRALSPQDRPCPGGRIDTHA